ncbi:hypothetical protein EV359DRAFT_69052 [Lentinula novae-zelandiae]|nr:hypothetical protein EV359DRAFT_69052 [Lentinula novae-zelandiae]
MDDILFQIESWLLGNYAWAAVTTLCVAEHIETLPREFRYMLLLFVMIQAIYGFPGNGTDEHCNQCRNKVIFEIASAFIISRFALDIWSTVLGVGVSTIGSPFQNLSRCLQSVSISSSDLLQIFDFASSTVELAIPLLALGYDIFIFILTAIKTVQHSLEMQRLNQSSITQVIIRDGTLYFLLMLVVAIIDMIFQVNSSRYYQSREILILPNILISRLMLNLRTYSEPGNTTISQGQQTRVSSLNFASNQMLGNIGAPLDGGSFNEEEEEEEEERVEMEAIGGQYDSLMSHMFKLVIVQPPEHKKGF